MESPQIQRQRMLRAFPAVYLRCANTGVCCSRANPCLISCSIWSGAKCSCLFFRTTVVSWRCWEIKCLSTWRENSRRENTQNALQLYVFEVALGLYKSSDLLTDERIAHMYSVRDYPPLVMAEKFYRYYVGDSFNDFIKAIARELKVDRDFKRNIAFRTAQLSKRGVDTAMKENKRLKMEIGKLKASSK